MMPSNRNLAIRDLAFRLHRNWMKRNQSEHPNGLAFFVPQARAFLGL